MMLGHDKHDIGIALFNSDFIIEAKVAKKSVYAFPPLGIFLISNALKVVITFFTSNTKKLHPFFLASNSLLT